MARSAKKASASDTPRTTKRTKGTKAAVKRSASKKAARAKAVPKSSASGRKTATKKTSGPKKAKPTASKAPRATKGGAKKPMPKPKGSKKVVPAKAATKSEPVTTAPTPAKPPAAKAPAAKASVAVAPPPPPEPPKPRKPQKPEVTRKMIEKIRESLEQQRAALFREFTDLEEGSFSLSQSDMSGEASFDEEYADAGSYTFEREKDLSIGNNIRDLLEKVTHALERIDRGTYGLCENCGDPINKDRLLALPYSSLCIRCKQREERTR